MRQVTARFSSDEVAAYAVSTPDHPDAVAQWAAETGLRVPVLLDGLSDASCWEVPDGDASLYSHFLNRSESDGGLGPFPLQLVIAPDGTLAYVDRAHHPELLLDVLTQLLDHDGQAGRDSDTETTP